MASLNDVKLIGYIGANPELSQTAGGLAVCNFSLATTDRWTDKNGDSQEKTQWHSITAWRGLAETCGKYLKKGDPVYVSGKLEYEKWTDKNGVDRVSAIVVIDDMQFLKPKSRDAAPE
jgi:single-strand DNA-binding protein